MEAIFQPTSRHIAMLAVLWPVSRIALYKMVRSYKTKQEAIHAIMIECNCGEKTAATAFDIGAFMIDRSNVNQSLLN